MNSVLTPVDAAMLNNFGMRSLSLTVHHPGESSILIRKCSASMYSASKQSNWSCLPSDTCLVSLGLDLWVVDRRLRNALASKVFGSSCVNVFGLRKAIAGVNDEVCERLIGELRCGRGDCTRLLLFLAPERGICRPELLGEREGDDGKDDDDARDSMPELPSTSSVMGGSVEISISEEKEKDDAVEEIRPD